MFKGKKLVSLLAATAMTVSSFALSVPAVSFAAETTPAVTTTAVEIYYGTSTLNGGKRVDPGEDESAPVFSLKATFVDNQKNNIIGADVVKFSLPDLDVGIKAYVSSALPISPADANLKVTDAKIKKVSLKMSDSLNAYRTAQISKKEYPAVVVDPFAPAVITSTENITEEDGDFTVASGLVSLDEGDAFAYVPVSDLDIDVLNELYEASVGDKDGASVDTTTVVEWSLTFEAVNEWATVGSTYELTFETTGSGKITENYTGKKSEETKDVDVTGKDYDHEYDGNGNKIKQGDKGKQEGTTPSATDTTTPAPSGEPTDTTTPAPSGEPTDTTTPAPTDEPTSTVEAGKVFELEDGATIKVTKNGKNCIIESIPSDVEEYTIPEFMTVGDVQLPVVKIATGAIVGKSNLKKLTILAKLNKIQKKALFDDANLETIAWSHPSTLKTLGKLNLRYLANGAKIQAGEPFSVPIEVKVKNRMGADAIAY